MTDAPERLAMNKRHLLGRITSGPLMDHPNYQQYIRADLAKPRVKQLVWEPWYLGDHFARTIVGIYNVNGNMWRKPHKRTQWEGPCADPYAAAQADYERRILEALE